MSEVKAECIGGAELVAPYIEMVKSKLPKRDYDPFAGIWADVDSFIKEGNYVEACQLISELRWYTSPRLDRVLAAQWVEYSMPPQYRLALVSV